MKCLLSIAVIFCALMVFAAGSWWAWRKCYSEGQLRAAMEADDSDKAYLLLRLGAPADEATFCWAVYNGNTDIAELMLRSGTVTVADRGLADFDESLTYLHWMAIADRTAGVELLLPNGAAMDATDENDRTPLHWVAESSTGRTTDTARALLAHGAAVDAKDEGGYTALHLAAKGGHRNLVVTLLAHGAAVDAKASASSHTGEDWTPLHLAAFNGHRDVAEVLLEYGAEVDARTSEGLTPLYLSSGREKDIV